MDRFEVRTRLVAFWLSVIAAIGVSALYLMMLIVIVFDGRDIPQGAEFLKRQFGVMIALPAAATISFILVVLLRQSSGPIEFEGLGFKFHGAAGQVAMWVICFLSLACAIRLCWIA